MTELPAPQCHSEDLLDMSVVAKFDPEQFARDGLWIWEGVLTPKGQQKMAEACLRVQARNDEWNTHDWQQYDWEAMGLQRPEPVAEGRPPLHFCHAPRPFAAHPPATAP